MALILSGDTGVPVTTVTGTLPVANGGSGVTTSTGTGAVVLGTAPTITGATITVAATAAPAFSAYLSSNMSPSVAWTKVTCDTEEFDTNANYDNVTNFRFTPTVAGYYQVNINAECALVSSSGLYWGIYKNGLLVKQTENLTGGSFTDQRGLSALISMNGSTDYLEFYVYLNGSAPRTVTGASTKTYFQAFFARSA
jgi:hypothetical protein